MEKVISCFISRTILDYVKLHDSQKYALLFKELDPEVDGLSDPEAYLRDPHQWISTEVCLKLFEKARFILNDEMAAFQIGKYGVENLALGYAQKILLKTLWSYQRALKNAQKFHDRWGKTKRVELVELNRADAVMRLHWESHLSLSKDFCLINKGIYSYMPVIWGGKPIRLQEQCCYFDGAPYCEYRLQWPARNRWHELRSRFFTTRAVLRETVKEMEADKKIIEQKYDEVNRLNAELRNKIQQLLALQETGKAILSVLDLPEVLNRIMNLLSSLCSTKRAFILIVAEEEPELRYLSGIGLEEPLPEAVRHYRLPLDDADHVLARIVRSGEAEYIADLQHGSPAPGDILQVLEKGLPAYLMPLVDGTKGIGVLVVGGAHEKQGSHEIRAILDIFTPQIAIAIENARLYGKLRAQMTEVSRSFVLLSRAEKFSFLGNIAARLAHEIKNPLTSIAAFIQMLPQKYEDEEFRTRFHAIAMEETERVNNLITELLDLVKTRESHFDLCSLNRLIEKMVLLVSPQTNAKRIEVPLKFTPEADRVWMDAEKMKQVILNLLGNAVDFTPENGRIEVETRSEKESDGQRTVIVQIKDNGSGIPPANLGRIFDPYFTTKHKSDQHNGTGLGLFIAHQNIQDHGGQIEVQSLPDQHTTFTLYFPADPPKNRVKKSAA
ncbi:MAG: sensor histidine kinase [Desulfobacteraceae bacterium]|nr:MAG: sensor histidine kinase [Desulfobacteraceae bacterium]